jgi:hypothetical protein
MAGTWTTERFPAFADAIRRLTAEHQELKDEPLHLAISYGPPREQQDIFLFEVIGGDDTLNPEGDLFEVTFLPGSGFPMAPSQKLHLILTNRKELQEATNKGWPLAMEILSALRSSGTHKVLHKDQLGKKILAFLYAEARRREAVRG